jgi:translocation and assembly module TamA
MLHLVRACLLVLLLLPLHGQAQSLTYTVTGLEGEPYRNVLAWLGEPPDSPQERLNFLVAARDKIESGLQAVGYYRPDIDIQIERTEPAWTLTIHVNPGEPVRIRDINIQLLGPAADDPEFNRIIADMGIAPGDVLHHGNYQDFRNSLLILGQQRGYFDADIVHARVEVEASAGTADISLEFNSGPRFRFGELLFDEELVEPKIVEQLRTFNRGDDFEQSRLLALQAQLQRTHYFAGVAVQPRKEISENDEVPIQINLVPAKRHTFDVGVGYSTDTQERLSLTWRTPKINRYGHSQVTRFEYSQVNPSGRFTYNIPLTHPLNDFLQLWLRKEDNEFGDLDSRQDEIGARRELRRGNWIYGYSLRDLDESWEVLQADAHNRYLLFGATLSQRVHTGSIVNPESGFNQLYTLEAGSEDIGSDVDLVRLVANLRYVATPLQGHRLVARTELGMVEIASGDRVELAPSLNFFAGGNQSIRGFAYQSIGNEIDVQKSNGKNKTLVVGGDRLVVASLEYQYYFNENWRGALFVDGGDAFDFGEFELNYGAGFGIHYMTPVGAVRVDLANSLSDDNPDWRLHITVGAEF